MLRRGYERLIEGTDGALAPPANYALEQPQECPVCRATSSRLLDAIPPYAHRACGGCGLVFLSPRVAESELPLLYGNLYQNAFTAEVPLDQQLANPTFAHRIRRLARATSGRRFFEVGCGDGNFLAVLRQQGWSVAGGDVTDASATAAIARHGIELAHLDFQRLQLPGTYDAVGAYHVLEHLYDPRPFLRGIRTALDTNGVLHLQLPNIRSLDGMIGGSLWFGLRVPEHVFLYRPDHVRRLLDEEGFSVLSLTTYDPYHGPGTVELTMRAVLKRRLGRLARLVRATGDPTVSGSGSAVAASAVPGPATRAVRVAAVAIARAQALVGLGNVTDVIARRER